MLSEALKLEDQDPKNVLRVGHGLRYVEAVLLKDPRLGLTG